MDAKAFEILDRLYPEDISFLDEADPFRFLCSVVLSAQTRDDYVNAVTPKLWAKYPEAADLACCDLAELEEIIHPLGFYRAKARNLKALAQEVQKLGGVIPCDINELVKLPGVGRKTANCYINHVLNEPAVIVDTHFARVAYRLGYTDHKDASEVEMDIRKNFPPSQWSRLSMTLNLHGRKYCHARKPDCGACPVSAYCRRA